VSIHTGLSSFISPLVREHLVLVFHHCACPGGGHLSGVFPDQESLQHPSAGSALGRLSIGQTVVKISGGIDLSDKVVMRVAAETLEEMTGGSDASVWIALPTVLAAGALISLSKLCRELPIQPRWQYNMKDGERYRNTGVLLSLQGYIVTCYRKGHLFSTEEEMFVPGDGSAVANNELGTVGFTICMDLLFSKYIWGLVLSYVRYNLSYTDWVRCWPIDQRK
jgi:hypothetical protein